MISENNILHTDFEGKTFLKENTWQNKISSLKKYLSWRIMLGINPTPSSGKKFYHDRFGEKILTQSKSPRPPPKSQIVGPKIVVFFSFLTPMGSCTQRNFLQVITFVAQSERPLNSSVIARAFSARAELMSQMIRRT